MLLGLGKFFKSNKNPDKKFISNLNGLLGFKIKDTLLFKRAFTHSSTNLKDKHGNVFNYERLEFLGDSILGTIISDHIYSNYYHNYVILLYAILSCATLLCATHTQYYYDTLIYLFNNLFY